VNNRKTPQESYLYIHSIYYLLSCVFVCACVKTTHAFALTYKFKGSNAPLITLSVVTAGLVAMVSIIRWIG